MFYLGSAVAVASNDASVKLYNIASAQVRSSFTSVYFCHPFHTYAVQAAVLCGSTNIFSRRKAAAVVLRKVATGLRSDCSQYGCFAVFAVY